MNDTELFTQVRELPEVQDRAAALGIDWDALRAARSRLLVGAWLISVGLALLVLAQPVGALIGSELSTHEAWNPRDFVVLVVAGGICAYFARLAAMFLARRLSSSPLRPADLRREVTVATVSQAALFPLLTLAACFLGTNDFSWLLGVAAAAPIATIVEIRPLTHFPIFLAQNSRFVEPVYTRMRAVSPLESLLGLRVRWILVRHLGASLFALGASYLVTTNGWLVIPVAAVAVILEFAAARLTLGQRPVRSALVQLLLGVVVFAAAAVIYLVPLLTQVSPSGPATV
jgi:hypothetical protein